MTGSDTANYEAGEMGESLKTAGNLGESWGVFRGRVWESSGRVGESWGFFYFGNCSTGTPSAFASFRRVER